MRKISSIKRWIFKNFYPLGLICVLVIGFILRLHRIANPIADWHSWRQADTAAVSRNFRDYGFDLLHPRFDDISSIPSGIENPQGYRFVEFPIENAIHALSAKLFTNVSFEVLGRLLSVFYSLISIVLIYHLVKLHSDRQVAFLSSVLFAVTPYVVYYSRVILPEPLIVTVSLLSLLVFSFYCNKPSTRNLILSILSFSCLLLLKAYMAIFVIPLGYLVFHKFGPSFYKRKKLILALVVAFLPFVFWFFWAKQFPEGIPFFKWAFNGDHIRFRPSFFYWIFGVRIGTLILGVWGTVLLTFGLLHCIKNRHFFFLWWAIGILSYLVIVATANVKHDYYQVIASPILLIMVAFGVKELWERTITEKFIATFSLFMMLLVGWKNIEGYYQINHPEIVEAGQRADQILPKDARIIAPYGADTAFLYQTKRKGWPYVTLPINELIEKGASYYVSVNFDDQTNAYMKEYTVIEKTPKYVIIKLEKPSDRP